MKDSNSNTQKQQKSSNLPDRIKTLLEYLNQNLYGKEEALRLTLLSAIAGENILLLGTSRADKSTVSRRIAAAFSDFYKNGKINLWNGHYFEYFMNGTDEPNDIFGPVDRITKQHQTENYLPNANIVLLDEIWNIRPTVLSTILKIINDKKYYNGNSIQEAPLLSAIAAAKEISFPPNKPLLAALRDSFTIRVFINPIQNNDDFFTSIDSEDDELKPDKEQKAALLSIEEVKLWQQEINKVELDKTTKKWISGIRESRKDISDRHWKKIAHILKTSAFLNGREITNFTDLSLIEYCIWDTNQQHDNTVNYVGRYLDLDTHIGNIPEQVKAFKDKKELTAFEKQEYAALDKLINSQIAAGKRFKDYERALFTNNIFANQQNLGIISEKTDILIAKFEKEKTELNRLHSLYAEK